MSLRARWLSVIASVCVIAAIFLVASGVGVVAALVLVGAIAIQTATGAGAWTLIVRRRTGVIESIGAGVALGTCLALVGSLLIQALGLGSWGWLLPTVLLGAGWFLARARGVVHRLVTDAADGLDRGVVLGLAVAGGLGLLSLAVNLRNYPLTWAGDWGRYHPDMLYFEALSTSSARFGPTDSIFMSDGVIRYHWLTYAWAGQLTELTGADPFVVLSRALPFVAVLGSTFLTISFTRRLTAVSWAPALAVVLLLSGGYVGATYGTILNFDSPSLALSTVWLLALCLAFILFVQHDPAPGRRRNRALGFIAAIGLLSFCISGGKISSGAVGAAAIAFVAAVALIRRESWRWAAVSSALAAIAGLALAYFAIVAGSADPGGLKIGQLIDRASSVQGLNPINGAIGIAAGTLILALAMSIRWAGLAWFLAAREARWSPVSMLGLGLVLTGIGTVLLMSGGFNETWFVLAASAPLIVISAAGAGEGAKAVGAAGARLRPSAPVLWAAAAGLALSLVVAVLWSGGASGGNVWVSSTRSLGPIVGFLGAVIAGIIIARNKRLTGSFRSRALAMTIVCMVCLSAPARLLGVGSGVVGTQPGLSSEAFNPVVPFATFIDTTVVKAWNPDHLAAAAWLREHAAPSELLATNITFSPFVPALTGQQMFIAGAQYQAPYGRPQTLQTVLDREAESWAFINEPSAASIRPLCDAAVRWVWVDPIRTATRSWAPFATVAFNNEAVTVLEINQAECQ